MPNSYDFSNDILLGSLAEFVLFLCLRLLPLRYLYSLDLKLYEFSEVWRY